MQTLTQQIIWAFCNNDVFLVSSNNGFFKGEKTNPFAALAFHQVGLLFYQKIFNWFGGVSLFSLSGNFVINEVGSTQRGRDVHNYNKFSWSQRALEQNNLDLKKYQHH